VYKCTNQRRKLNDIDVSRDISSLYKHIAVAFLITFDTRHANATFDIRKKMDIANRL